MLQATTTAAILLALVLQAAWLKVDGATCDSLEVTDPTSLRNSTGWVSQDVGAGELRQGHVSAEIFAWDQEYIVVYGGTDTRTDDVNDVLAGGSRVSLLDTSTMLSWESLEMVAYDGSPPPLFRPASFVWGNSLFLSCGHTAEPFTVTDGVWRADIQGFVEAPEGLWRPVNTTTEDSIGGEVTDVARYGHTATVLDTGESDPTEIWVIVMGGMTGSQGNVDTNLVLYLSDVAETIECKDNKLNATTSTYTCAQRTHVRPTETTGEWWHLDERLDASSSSGPSTRAYHTAASLSTDGQGSSTCMYVFGGRDYEFSVLYSDLWRLCPVSGSLGNSLETTFIWTELSPTGTLPSGRYGATLSPGIADSPYRLLLYGGTGRYPNTYMADAFTREYDAYMNAWVDSPLEDGSTAYPVGRRDHTFEGIGDFLVLIAGINNDEDALQDMWRVNYSSPMCGAGDYMFFCEATSAPVCGVCANGTATERASYTCETCVSGYFALAGSEECSPCPAGKYGTGDGGVVEETACSDCPAGTSTTNGEGTATVDGCFSCEAGTFSLVGALVCSPCPSGFYSGVRASECIPCAIGTYRQIDSASGDCDPCAAGTYAPFEQASLCLDCPRGFYSEAGGASACSPCPAGTAGSRIAGGGLADACVDCAAGEYSTADASMACEQCLAGTASSTVGADNDDVCEICPEGTFSSAGASTCQDCIAGQFGALTGIETCELCSLGTYLNATGSISSGACVTCPQGSTTLAAGSNSSTDCLACPPGTRTVSLTEGGGCENCPRGEYTSTYDEAQSLNCTQCAGGFYADVTGEDECTECADEELSYNAHATCSTCISNTSCPLGANGEACSGLGNCYLGVCACDTGFNNVDCSNGTCDGCSGIFGFNFESAVVATAESGGTVNLTLVRLAGTDGEVSVTVDIIQGNATVSSDYGGTWPTQVVFPDGESEIVLPLPILHDNVPNEGCEVVTIGVTAVSGGGVAVTDGGIYDVSAKAVVKIEEDDFVSAVRETVAPEGSSVEKGGLSPATAEVVIADAMATWESNVTLSVAGTTPSNWTMALPRDIVLLAESDVSVSTDLGRLAELQPGLTAEMHSSYPSTMFGVAAFATDASSYYYELLEPLTLDAYPVVAALEEVAASSLLSSEDPPGAQIRALFQVSDDVTNGTGWREDVFRVAAVITGSHFAEPSGFDAQDTSTWVIPHTVTVSELSSRLSSAGVHPIFLLTNASLYEEYRALVAAIGFGAVVAFDEGDALGDNYNDNYLPKALEDGLEALYAQAALLIESDDGAFVASVTPGPDAFRNETPGTEVNFLVNMSATPASAPGSGEVILSFQGHKTVVSVVREFASCDTPTRSRVSGATVAALDDSRAGWLQGFNDDEAIKWVLDPAYSFGNATSGPFGVSTKVLSVSCPGGCSEVVAYQDVNVASDSELPLVLKTYFYLSPSSEVTAASTSLDVTYTDGSSSEAVVTLDFGASPGDTMPGTWTPSVDAVYPTEVVISARVTLTFTGTGDAAFSGVALFAHPDVACRCNAGYYLDVGSAPARLCTPQPECTYFEGWCTYCPAGYKCPQGGVLAACLPGEYSMGGSTECLPCPVGWLCSEGLGVPCGYGASLSTVTTNVQEEEGSTSSTSGVYGGSCASCPAGYACPGAGVVEECAAGMFSPGGGPSNMCMPCPPGSFANASGAGACDDCPAGSTSNFGAWECSECPPGFVSEARQYPCEPCGMGTSAEAGDPECTPCPLGFYADKTAMWTCEACPGSSTTASVGSTSESDCA